MTNSQIVERYTTLVHLLNEFTASIVYEPSEANRHFTRLWMRMLGLCNSLSLLAKNGDASAAQIILRTQLEVFARLQFFRAKPDEAWLTERSNELAQWQKVQRHHDHFPSLPYSINIQHHIDECRQKWSDISFRTTKTGYEKVEGRKEIWEIFEAIADAKLIGMSAYGLYQLLCGETHAGMLNVAARHTLDGRPNSESREFADESVVLLRMSAWLLGKLTEPFLEAAHDHAHPGLVDEIWRMHASIDSSNAEDFP